MGSASSKRARFNSPLRTTSSHRRSTRSTARRKPSRRAAETSPRTLCKVASPTFAGWQDRRSDRPQSSHRHSGEATVGQTAASRRTPHPATTVNGGRSKASSGETPRDRPRPAATRRRRSLFEGCRKRQRDAQTALGARRPTAGARLALRVLRTARPSLRDRERRPGRRPRGQCW